MPLLEDNDIVVTKRQKIVSIVDTRRHMLIYINNGPYASKENALPTYVYLSIALSEGNGIAFASSNCSMIYSCMRSIVTAPTKLPKKEYGVYI